MGIRRCRRSNRMIRALADGWPLAWCAGLLFASLLLGGCTSVFILPDRVQYFPGRDLKTEVHDTWIRTADGSALHALWLPAAEPARGVVLFLHGNAENLTSHVHAVRWLPAHGYSVLALDYRGFGQSEGESGIDQVHEDASAALDWLVAQPSAAPVVVYGQSLGGSVALRLVASSPHRARIRAVIADSAFSGYRRIAREKLGQLWLTWPLQWPLSFLISDRWSAVDVVARVAPIPLLLIHGDQDVVVPPSHAQRLYDAAGEPKALWRIAEGRHIDAMTREPIRERLVEYLDVLTEPTPLAR